MVGRELMVRKASILFVAMVVIVVASLLGVKQRSQEDVEQTMQLKQPRIALDQKSLSFYLQQPDGQWQSSNELLRPVTIVVFVAKWFPQTDKLIDQIIQVKTQVDDNQVAFVLISLNQNEWRSAQQVSQLSMLVVPDQVLNKVPDLITGIPTFYCLNQSGTIVRKLEGSLSAQALLEIISELN